MITMTQIGAAFLVGVVSGSVSTCLFVHWYFGRRGFYCDCGGPDA